MAVFFEMKVGFFCVGFRNLVSWLRFQKGQLGWPKKWKKVEKFWSGSEFEGCSFGVGAGGFEPLMGH